MLRFSLFQASFSIFVLFNNLGKPFVLLWFFVFDLLSLHSVPFCAVEWDACVHRAFCWVFYWATKNASQILANGVPWCAQWGPMVLQGDQFPLIWLTPGQLPWHPSPKLKSWWHPQDTGCCTHPQSWGQILTLRLTTWEGIPHLSPQNPKSIEIGSNQGRPKIKGKSKS